MNRDVAVDITFLELLLIDAGLRARLAVALANRILTSIRAGDLHPRRAVRLTGKENIRLTKGLVGGAGLCVFALLAGGPLPIHSAVALIAGVGSNHKACLPVFTRRRITDILLRLRIRLRIIGVIICRWRRLCLRATGGQQYNYSYHAKCLFH
jgi:hypothetical protein